MNYGKRVERLEKISVLHNTEDPQEMALRLAEHEFGLQVRLYNYNQGDPAGSQPATIFLWHGNKQRVVSGGCFDRESSQDPFVFDWEGWDLGIQEIKKFLSLEDADSDFAELVCQKLCEMSESEEENPRKELSFNRV
jgi:hypothetical protein